MGPEAQSLANDGQEGRTFSPSVAAESTRNVGKGQAQAREFDLVLGKINPFPLYKAPTSLGINEPQRRTTTCKLGSSAARRWGRAKGGASLSLTQFFSLSST